MCQVQRQWRGKVPSLLSLVGRELTERSKNLLRIDVGTQGCGTANFDWVVMGHPAKVILD